MAKKTKTYGDRTRRFGGNTYHYEATFYSRKPALALAKAIRTTEKRPARVVRDMDKQFGLRWLVYAKRVK